RVVERWIDTATAHGVNIFIYDWYWYDGAPFLENALNNGFLGARNNDQMRFYLMWANHEVKKNYWNVHRYQDDESLLFDVLVDWEQFKTIVARVIGRYFSRPNYFTISGCPVFAIFHLERLLTSFGGSADEARRALDYFRVEVAKAGFPGLHLQWTHYEPAAGEPAVLARQLGLDSAGSYLMGRPEEDYLAYGRHAAALREQTAAALGLPLFPCVSTGWDDTPRFPRKGARDTVHENQTPENFAAFLRLARDYADRHPQQPRLITLNAWNEWVEGCYLLPDRRHGFAYLEAVKTVFVDGR
ncbi:MAG: glycoside hydrolase family 99-like domain-containing protein, partial [Verrucomicrobiales bacterium]|nr:glycoside hydrolase family 99-like domain-containing protein [Verrucomicrobiales bacterium]